MKESLYRVEAVWYCGGIFPHITLRIYPIKRKTKCGFWIHEGGQDRFVLDSGRKRFAWKTEALAIESFKARKVAQIRILKAQLKRAESELYEANERGIYSKHHITEWMMQSC